MFAKRRGGYQALRSFIEDCQNDVPLPELAQRHRMSVSRACELRLIIMQRIWVPRKATLDYIEFMARVDERRAEEKHQTVQSHLRLIWGRE